MRNKRISFTKYFLRKPDNLDYSSYRVFFSTREDKNKIIISHNNDTLKATFNGILLGSVKLTSYNEDDVLNRSCYAFYRCCAVGISKQETYDVQQLALTLAIPTNIYYCWLMQWFLIRALENTNYVCEILASDPNINLGINACLGTVRLYYTYKGIYYNNEKIVSMSHCGLIFNTNQILKCIHHPIGSFANVVKQYKPKH